MSRKILFLFAVLILLLAGGGYWYTTHRLVSLPVGGHAPAGSPSGAGRLPPVGSEATGGKPAASEVEKKSGVAPAAPALRVGEAFEYAANVSKLNSTIASIKLAVIEQHKIGGKPAWHLQASAHTENPYRMVFELDDQFDSYSDPAVLASLQYEMHLSERGQKIDSVQRLLSSPAEAAPAGEMAARVLPGTRDPLGMVQYLRSVDWNKTAEVRSPVYDGRKLYDVRAVVLGRTEPVTVPTGKYATTKIEIHVVDNGTEMKDTHFLLYLANDAARTPVLMEAVLPIATARLELTQVR